MLVYDEQYIKAKVREFDGVVKTIFLAIDPVIRMEKKIYPQVYLEECKNRMKKTKIRKFIKAELE